MNKNLKIFLTILLILILGIEIYLYFTKTEDSIISDNNDVKETKEIVNNDYKVDVFTGYSVGSLTYKEIKESKQVYYKTISGLKDKIIENKVNDKIKEKIDKLKESLDKDHSLSNVIVSNFENTISIGFCLNERFDGDFYECDSWDSIDALNIDLNTGNELTLLDIVNNKEIIKSKILQEANIDFSRMVAFACSDGDCAIKNPDFSMVEEEQLQIARKFNNDDYTFVFDPESISIIFNDVRIKEILECDDNEKGCYKVKAGYGGEDSYTWTESVKDYYNKTYNTSLYYLDFVDNVVIYDKFRKEDNIYEKGSTKVDKKFTLNGGYDVGEIANNIFIEEDNYLVDYSLSLEYLNVEDIDVKIRNSLLKEMIKNNNKFTIYNVFGNSNTIRNYDYKTKTGNDYDYVYFTVYEYQLDKNTYNQNKRQIYIDKYDKLQWGYGGTIDYRTDENDEYYTYPYLKKYLTNKKFYYYIYDKNGNELNAKDILNKDYLEEVIPSEWYTLGGYNNIDDMVKNSLIIRNTKKDFSNYLVIYEDWHEIKLKYKGKEIVLINQESYDYDEYENIQKKLYK